MSDAPRLLHVLNGDSTRELLERTEVPGTFAVWADALHDGPVPRPGPDDADGARWRATRARFVAAEGLASHDDALATMARWDAALERHAEYDEVVIWCEHDLFDQLLLIRHLAWFGARALGDTTLSLLCVGDWPGRPHFKGLGELASEELAALFPRREPVTARQLALGRRAWDAFTSADPRAVADVVDDADVDALPYLADALRRHLEEFPSVRDGLARTDRQLLQLVAQGTTRLGELFPALHRLERCYFVGDTSFLARLRRLGGGPRPLLRLEGGQGPWWHSGRAALTDDGRAVLAGAADWVRLAGIDEWRGGVRLAGTESPWRWDAGAGRLRAAADPG